MGDRKTFGGKVKDTLENVKDKIMGHSHEKEEEDKRQIANGPLCRATGVYADQCRHTNINERQHEPESCVVIDGEIVRPGNRKEADDEPGVLGTEIKEPGTFGGQLGETSVIGGLLGETSVGSEGALYETDDQMRNELYKHH